MRSVIDFLKYNNLVPVIVGAVLLGAGAVIAASNPTVRQAVFPAAVPPREETVVPAPTDAVELMAVNLKIFDPQVRIRSVREDEEAYLVEYAYRTYEVAAGKWHLLPKSGKLAIPKAQLGDRDLGLSVAEEIGEVVSRELTYLSEVQKAEKAKLAAARSNDSTEYAGLVGRRFDAKKQEIAGYEPVVVPDEAAGEEEEHEDTDRAETIVVETGTASGQTTLSPEEIQAMILKAVSDFLAIETERLDGEAAVPDVEMPAIPLSDEAATTTVPEEAPESPESSVATPGEE
jgi:hypothetical protein